MRRLPNLGQGKQRECVREATTAFTHNTVTAAGVDKVATNLGGNNNLVAATGGTALTRPGLNNAFNIDGSSNNNTATASGGPIAVAGTVGGSGKTAARTTPGITVK